MSAEKIEITASIRGDIRNPLATLVFTPLTILTESGFFLSSHFSKEADILFDFRKLGIAYSEVN